MAEPFLTARGSAVADYEAAMRQATRMVTDALASRTGPTSGAGLTQIRERFEGLEVCPERGMPLEQALREVGDLVLGDTVVVSHPRYAAHLHSPPTISSLAADVLIAATNQSLDSFDSGPSAAVAEQHVVAWANRLVGFGDRGDGVFTSGGTASNLTALLVARDDWAMRALGWNVRSLGLPQGFDRLRIVASESSHFSIERAAHILGLGRSAVVTVPTAADGGLDIGQLEHALANESRRGRSPFALVLTAGTTDSGSVDPIGEATALAHRYGLWVHVDAAAAGALMLSERHRPLLHGIERADSVTIDFHKLFCQSISSSIVLVGEGAKLRHLRSPVSYLDPVEDADEDVLNLVGRSLQTTRRFDALKVLVSLRTMGRARVAGMVESFVALAAEAARRVRGSAHLELLQAPSTNTVLFRWCSPLAPSAEAVDWVNQRLPHELWRRGTLVIGRTRHGGRPCLRLTFCNPTCGPAEVEGMLAEITAVGGEILASWDGRRVAAVGD